MPPRNHHQYLIPEPIDYVTLLANRKTRTQRGDVRPRAEVDRLVASRKRNAETKRKKIAAANRKPKKPKPEFSLKVRIAKLFQPGLWYATPDLIRLAKGVPRGSVKARLVTMTRGGEIERAQNPAWQGPTVYSKGVPMNVAAKGRQPEWLYRLTEAGLALRG